ncbi:hypothetical protein CQJ30_18690 [Caldibacillus thermoamylovorans]|nr:hypothetical protein CQJ30_18690 [Caldibacillus thermoamylovorans]
MRFYEQVFGLSKQDLASRLGVSSPKKPDFRPKKLTRRGLVVKKVSFSAQNDDENAARRQKVTTRKSLVAKKWSFPSKSDDEKESRRQKNQIFAQKS